MTLFLSTDALRQRKRDLQDPAVIGGLAASLQRVLHAALDVPVPHGKSRLTRNGGRCATCTVLLTFDPRSPYAHTCPTCGAVYADQVHHEWWLMNGHLWTAEQCTRAAAIAYLLDDQRAARRCDDILESYAARYASWPNRDNALGPTHPFFSTYLESIWLLHLAAAIDLRSASSGRIDARLQTVLDTVVEPSARLIAGFDEGRSNRQVWHAAAMLAAAELLDDHALRVKAADSLRALLRDGLHTDGSWYEGENYHLFAHRGLLTGVTLAERAGIEMRPDVMARFELGFSAPFRTMLPDGTFPARRDSQYGVALRQYRTADWVECGFARNDTPELRAALASLYATRPARGDTYRWSSSADAERNMPGVRLTRADCSWRALLLARLELPPFTDAVPKSELLEGQGLAVLRRSGGKFWVGLDYGDPGDGHGHPDRLNLVIATPECRWLDDVGTGSYTSPTLAWYRSSLAHNAPMVNGQDQGAARGSLLAYDETGDAGWVSAAFVDPVSGVRFVRTVVVMGDHVLDEITWTSNAEVTVDIPMQARVTGPPDSGWTPYEPHTSQDDALSEISAIPWRSAHVTLRGVPSPAVREVSDAACAFACAVHSDSDATFWRAATIGPPAGQASGLVALRQIGTSGRSVRVFAAAGVLVNSIATNDSVIVETTPNARYVHRRVGNGWLVSRENAGSDEPVALHGTRELSAAPVAVTAPSQTATIHMHRSSAFLVTLGESQYRPTEESWVEAGEPRAHVAVCRSTTDADRLVINARVELGREPVFAAICETNPLDNELADVNSDGVQLHWRSAHPGAWNGVIAVPDGVAVRVTAAEGTTDAVTARWEPHTDGYTVVLSLPWPVSGEEFVFDVIINERPHDRERRRGQLVLSGARGEFAYLRGARQSPDRALRVVFDPAQP